MSIVIFVRKESGRFWKSLEKSGKLCLKAGDPDGKHLYDFFNFYE